MLLDGIAPLRVRTRKSEIAIQLRAREPSAAAAPYRMRQFRGPENRGQRENAGPPPGGWAVRRSRQKRRRTARFQRPIRPTENRWQKGLAVEAVACELVSCLTGKEQGFVAFWGVPARLWVGEMAECGDVRHQFPEHGTGNCRLVSREPRPRLVLVFRARYGCHASKRRHGPTGYWI